MSTTGLNVGVHYCGDMFVGVIVNGVSVTTNDVQGMENCMDDNNQCSHCKTIHHKYKVVSQFMQGQQVHTAPLISVDNGFICALPANKLLPLIVVEEGNTLPKQRWRTPYNPKDYSQNSGLRAPPTQCPHCSCVNVARAKISLYALFSFIFKRVF